MLNVLDEALEEVSLLSYVTSEVLESVETLRDVLGQDLADFLIKHRAVLASTSKGGLGSDASIQSTRDLVRLLKKGTAGSQLQKLGTERSDAMLQVIEFLTKLRQSAQKKLTTTVEEDSSNREYFEQVREREERAVAEKIQLEQKLKLQRVELLKQAKQMQSSEDRTRAELADLTAWTGKQHEAIVASSKQIRTEDNKSFKEEEEELQRELDQAKAELARLKEDNKAQELQLHKNKKRSQQEVELVINEYDKDLGAKEDEYRAAHKEYTAVITKLEFLTKGYNEMHQERLEYEELQRQLEHKRLIEGLQRVREQRAARVIQAAYAAFKARKIAEAKKRKKAEAAKAKMMK